MGLAMEDMHTCANLEYLGVPVIKKGGSRAEQVRGEGVGSIPCDAALFSFFTRFPLTLCIYMENEAWVGGFISCARVEYVNELYKRESGTSPPPLHIHRI